MKLFPARLMFLFLILYSITIYGQGNIKGFVIDSLSLDQLKGAEITLAGTTFNAVSNTDGEIHIIGIPPGEYMLQTTFLGYQEKRYLINIESEKTLDLRVELLPTVTIEDGMIFTQQAKSQVEEINLQIKSNTIKNVIAGGKLQDLPDENIPVALSRLPGVSLKYAPPLSIPFFSTSNNMGDYQSIEMPFPPQDDFSLPDDPVSRIIIRGLDSKHANITIDGIRVSPTSTKDKSVDLGIFSERNFQNIEIQKTITSDADADATAGAINIVTGQAPYSRTIKAELLGNKNKLDKSINQYNFTGNYSERFFENVLGIRANAHIEKKIMSNEYVNEFGNFSYTAGGHSYTNAVKEKNGGSILIDFKTPDGGVIKFNNIFNKTNADNFKSDLVWGFGGNLSYIFSNRKAEQRVFLSSIGGCNYLFGFDVNWDAVFSESQVNHPYDYILALYGSSLPPRKYPRPLDIDTLNYTLNGPSKNYCRERSASVDIHKKYTISSEFTGELKFGAKYRVNTRSYDENSRVEGVNPILLPSLQDDPPAERTIFDVYEIPMINKNALLSWCQSHVGNNYMNDEPNINSYNLSERVSAVYLMHYLNFGQYAKFITGVRIESEHNDYSGYYFPNAISNILDLYNNLPKQTNTYHYNKTTILPNVQMILQPTNFLNMRMAVYKTLIRPDCIARMPKYFSIVSYNKYKFLATSDLNFGNPDLENSDVWNYEYQTQIYLSDFGQFSINGFLKEIKGIVQATNGKFLSGTNVIESLGVNWRNYTSVFPLKTTDQYNIFSHYNSSKPTRIWGFEFEHQASFRFLPGFLKNIVLNYNFTFLRSETWIKDVKQIYTTKYEYLLSDKKQKINDIPDFYENVSLGYDIKGFSLRVSYFYQDGYPMYDDYFSDSTPIIINKGRLSRWDIAVRQQLLENISVSLNLNNITNTKEESLFYASVIRRWDVAQAYRYGMNIDFGLGIKL